MKKLFAEFKISNSLNGGSPLSRFWRRVVGRSSELQRFEREARELDRRLASPPSVSIEPPAAMHEAIMRSLRQARSSKISAISGSLASSAVFRRRALATTLAVALVASGWMAATHPRHSKTARVAGPAASDAAWAAAELQAAWDYAGQMSTNAPMLAVQPITEPLTQFSKDLREAALSFVPGLP
jgi:hypothetical protein